MLIGIWYRYVVIGLFFVVRLEVGVLFVQGSDVGYVYVWMLCIVCGVVGVFFFGNFRYGVKCYIN